MDKDKIIDEVYAMLEELPKQPSNNDLMYLAEDLAVWHIDNAEDIVRQAISLKDKMDQEEKIDESKTKLKKKNKGDIRKVNGSSPGI